LSVADSPRPLDPAFLSGLTHELRTPLNSVLMMSELLAETLAEAGRDAAGEREARYARNIHQAAEDLLELVNQAGELGRIEAGRLPVEARSLAVAELARRLEEAAAEDARAAEARLTVEVAAAAPERVTTDPEKLLRAAGLLVAAALHASRGGEVAVTLAAGGGEGSLELRVADSGPPPDDAERASLFVPFGGAGPRTTRRFGGTGLGLPVAHALAQLLGGRLTAEPAGREGGCLFVLSIP
jgi:signal transduction histidine kinase